MIPQDITPGVVANPTHLDVTLNMRIPLAEMMKDGATLEECRQELTHGFISEALPEGIAASMTYCLISDTDPAQLAQLLPLEGTGKLEVRTFYYSNTSTGQKLRMGAIAEPFGGQVSGVKALRVEGKWFMEMDTTLAATCWLAVGGKL